MGCQINFREMKWELVKSTTFVYHAKFYWQPKKFNEFSCNEWRCDELLVIDTYTCDDTRGVNCNDH